MEPVEVETLESWFQGLSDKARQRAYSLIERVAAAINTGGGEPTDNPGITTILNGLEKNLRDNPSAGKWLSRLLEQLGDKPLEKMVTNFFFNVAYESFAIREDYRRRTGLLPPMTVVINPTMRCNLKCQGCYAWNFHKQDMDYAMLKRLLSELKDMGVRFITVSGGEPLLYPHLFEMLEEFDDMIFMSYTNATLIDEAMAKRLADYGNFWPAVSVEGYRKETDRRRGSGVFDKVVSAMEHLRRHGVMFGFSATPVRSNSDILADDKFLDYMLDQGCLFGWFFNYIPVGKDTDFDLMPTPEQRNRLRLKTREWITSKPIFLGDFWNDGPAAGGCLSASRYAYITVEGYVQPCTFVHFYTHSLQDHTFEEIWLSPFFESIRQRQPYNRNLLRPCKIIDEPEVLEEVVEENGAKPSYEGADKILTDPDLRAKLKNYSEQYGELADKAWAGPEYQEGRSVLVPFLGRVNIWEFYGDRLKEQAKVKPKPKERRSEAELK